MMIAALTAASQGWAQDSSIPQYHLLKKIVLGGEGGWDYLTVDPATHHIFIGRRGYVSVLDSGGNVVGKLDVRKPSAKSRLKTRRNAGFSALHFCVFERFSFLIQLLHTNWGSSRCIGDFVAKYLVSF
jgi:hypothetical protein